MIQKTEPELYSKLFLNFGKFEPSYSYKLHSYINKVCRDPLSSFVY